MVFSSRNMFRNTLKPFKTITYTSQTALKPIIENKE
jgi:hypothetical protein